MSMTSPVTVDMSVAATGRALQESPVTARVKIAKRTPGTILIVCILLFLQQSKRSKGTPRMALAYRSIPGESNAGARSGGSSGGLKTAMVIVAARPSFTKACGVARGMTAASPARTANPLVPDDEDAPTSQDDEREVVSKAETSCVALDRGPSGAVRRARWGWRRRRGSGSPASTPPA